MKAKTKPKSLLYIKLSALADLCRYACNFDYTNSTVISIKSGETYRLFAIGEEIGKVTMAYYVSSARPEGIISYTYPSSRGESENVHFVKEMEPHPRHCINVLDISSTNIKNAGKVTGKDIAFISIKTREELIGAVIRRSISAEELSHLYEFDYKGKTITCTFDLIDGLSEDITTMYYSVSSGRVQENFARYKYAENKIDFTDYMGEHSYMYAKIIHLAEPFPFFKLPD